MFSVFFHALTLKITAWKLGSLIHFLSLQIIGWYSSCHIPCGAHSQEEKQMHHMKIEFTYNNEPIIGNELPVIFKLYICQTYPRIQWVYQFPITFINFNTSKVISITQKCNLAKRVLCYRNCLFWNCPLVICKIGKFRWSFLPPICWYLAFWPNKWLMVNAWTTQV